MKNIRSVLILIVTIIFFWFIKFILNFPSADIQIIGVILTVASILFGFLAGFFISELWSRYTQIREMEGIRGSEGLNLVRYASYFYNDKKFKKYFTDLVEKSCVAEESINYDQGYLVISYYQDIEMSFRKLKLKSIRDGQYFNNLLDSYHSHVRSVVRLDTLYRERLFFSEWIMLTTLSTIIAFSLLFLDVSHFFYKVIVLIFPAILVLALNIIYDLDKINWSREIITIEPTERILDSIGKKRYYLKSDIKYISPMVTDYRTEDDLKGELKKLYDSIVKV